METVTLQDVISRMKTEGDLNRNSGSNSIKSLKDIAFEQSVVLKNIASTLKSQLSLASNVYGPRPIEPLEKEDEPLEKEHENGDSLASKDDIQEQRQLVTLYSIRDALVDFHNDFKDSASLTKLQNKQDAADELQKTDDEKPDSMPNPLLDDGSDGAKKKSSFFGKILGGLGAVTSLFFKPLAGLFGALKSIAKKFILPALAIWGVLNALSEGLGAWEENKDKPMFTRILETLKGFVKGFISSIGGAILSVFTGKSYEESKQLISDEVDKFFGMIGDVFNWISDQVSELWYKSKRFLGLLNKEDLDMAERAIGTQGGTRKQSSEAQQILEDVGLKNPKDQREFIVRATNEQLYQLADEDFDDFEALVRLRNTYTGGKGRESGQMTKASIKALEESGYYESEAAKRLLETAPESLNNMRKKVEAPVVTLEQLGESVDMLKKGAALGLVSQAQLDATVQAYNAMQAQQTNIVNGGNTTNNNQTVNNNNSISTSGLSTPSSSNGKQFVNH